MMNILQKAAVAVAIALPTVASASSYSIVDDFGTGVFQYGFGNGGASFAAYGAPATCGGFLTCYRANGGLPEVIGNTTNTDYSDGGAFIPANSVYFHPGSGLPNSDSIIRFVAPTAGSYSVSGTFSRQNPSNGAGDGVIVSVFAGTTSLYSSAIAPTTLGASVSYGPVTALLAAGDPLDFVVRNGVGGNSFDGTGVAATTTSNAAVPEPTSWAMMIAGFALAGAALRRSAPVAARLV